MKKGIQKSWTVWINFIILALTMLDKEYLGLLGLGEQAVALFMATMLKVTAILNLILRIFFTRTALVFKPVDES